MEKNLYDEMVHNVDEIDAEMDLASMKVFLFGHCNATLELIDLLESKGIKSTAILDNSKEKQGLEYKGAVVVWPDQIVEMTWASTGVKRSKTGTVGGVKHNREVADANGKKSIVLITSRFYAAMLAQLRELGYEGQVRKVIDYNTYAEYSLLEDTIARMKVRERYGNELLNALSRKYEGRFKLFCPFNALGDIYFMMSYWPAFAGKRGIKDAVFCVTGRVLADVIHLFGDEEQYPVEIYKQKDLDAMIQSVIYTQDTNCFIAHQDRPYVVNLNSALYIKKIPLEQIYCCGVYGLPMDTEAAKPLYPADGVKRAINLSMPVNDRTDIDGKNDVDGVDVESIPQGKAVIFSPYAKSVTAIDSKVWEGAVGYYNGAGYKCYTNVVGDEKPLDGTKPISPKISEMRSVVEQAGTFIGIRSGLCDILRETNAKKIALYPDYNYCDTKWKSIEMYWIDQFEYNLLATEAIAWEKL